MRLVIIAVAVWAAILSSLAFSGWLVRRLRRQYHVQQESPVSDRWLADHIRNTTGDRS
jgi:hypothetical protein